MKQIIFKKLYIKNFLSVGNIPVEINFKTGLNVITGNNLDKEDSANGVGKSTIADALYFSLFGESLRELNKDQVVNNINKKDCKVMISFDVIDNNIKNEFTIVRGLFPTTLQLFKNGTDITQSSVNKTTDFLTKTINATAEVFKNSVIMSVNSTLPFMAQKKIDKRKFIEGILTLGVFSEMLLVARSRYNDVKKDIDIDIVKNNEIQKTYNVYIDQQTKQKIQKTDRLKVLKDRQLNNEKEIIELQPTIKNIIDTEIDECKNNIKLLKQREQDCKIQEKEINTTINGLSANILHNKEKIKDIENRGDECYACKRGFEDNEKLMFENEKIILANENIETNKIISTNLDKIKEIEIIQDKCKLGIEKYSNRIHEIEAILNKNKSIESRLEQLNTWNQQLIIDIDEINKQQDAFDTLIKETQERLKIVDESLKSLKNRLNILDTVKFIVSEEGVKSFIVKKMLKLLNGKLAYYLKKLDANCTCEFNEYFEEKIVNDKKQECGYNNFSGGERKRIDLAMLFTFMDIRKLQANVFINVSFYDEIFDSSLDAKGVKLFLEILNERIDKYKEAIYIISHNKTAINIASNASDVIYLQKKNGFTTKENINDAAISN